MLQMAKLNTTRTPDYGHVQKNINNKLFYLRKNHPSLNSKYCLSNVRIKSIHSDLRDPIKEYNEEGVGKKEA